MDYLGSRDSFPEPARITGDWTFTKQHIQNIVAKRKGSLYLDSDSHEVWGQVDTYYKRKEEIKLTPKVYAEDKKQQERISTRVNFAKRITKATTTMVMRGGVEVTDESGMTIDKRIFDERVIERSVRYLTMYGGCWFHFVEDPEKPYRIYKPEVAVEIPDPDDNDIVRAVLAVEQLRDERDPNPAEHYRFTWYEYARTESGGVDYGRVRKLVCRVARTANPDFTKPESEVELNNMPLFLAKNGNDDEVWENSDLVDSLELFDSYERNFALLDAGLEDEAFRQLFLAGVSSEDAQKIMEIGPRNIIAAKNPIEEHEARLYSVPPSDKRQFLDALNSKTNDIAMSARISPLELSNLPITDIPTSTLLTLYGPQLARCAATAKVASQAWTAIHHLWNLRRAYDPNSKAKVKLKAELPVNIQRRLENELNMHDRGFMSGAEIMRNLGYEDSRIEKVLRERESENERFIEDDTPSPTQQRSRTDTAT